MDSSAWLMDWVLKENASAVLAGAPATARDVRRQTVADLLHLTASLGSMNVAGHGFDTESVRYVGISSLNVPGGGMAKMFDGSPIFTVQTRPALDAAGLVFGSKIYEDFLNRGQIIEDSGDPINYPLLVAKSDSAIYISEMGGDSESNPLTPPALVLPNDLMSGPLYNGLSNPMGMSDIRVAETAPLSGTTLLWRNMVLQPLTEGVATERPIRRVARIAGGRHYSLHMPARPPAQDAISTALPVQNGRLAMETIQRKALQLLTSLVTELQVAAGEAEVLVE